MDKVKINKFAVKLILITILLIAAYFRFFKIVPVTSPDPNEPNRTITSYNVYTIRDFQMFLGDQGRDVLVVKRMLVDHKLTLLGPTASVGGFFLGPVYYYLMLIPLALSNLDPVGPAIMVAVFSIITTYLCYWFGKKFVNETTGLLAAAVYAVSKLAVEYARSSWNPNVLPFFSLLLIIGFAVLLSDATKRRWLWLLMVGGCLGIVIQLHYAAVALYFLAVVLFILMIIRESYHNKQNLVKKCTKEGLLLLVGLLITLSPFIAFELRHGHQNLNNVLQFVFANKERGFSGGYSYEFLIRDTAFRLFLRLVAGGYDLVNPWGTQDQNTTYIVWGIITTTLIGSVLALYKCISRFFIWVKRRSASPSIIEDLNWYFKEIFNNKTAAAWIVLGLWFIVGVGFWGFYKKSIYDYYYSYMYPLPILLFAFSINTILYFQSRRYAHNQGIKVLLTAIKVTALGIVLLAIVQNVKAINAIAPAQQVMRAEMVAKAVLEHKTDGPYNFALITAGNSDHAYRYFLEIYGAHPTTLEEEVTPQLMVFCEMLVCKPLGDSLWEVAGFGPATIVGQWEAIGWPMFRLEHLPETKYLEGKPAPKG